MNPLKGIFVLGQILDKLGLQYLKLKIRLGLLFLHSNNNNNQALVPNFLGSAMDPFYHSIQSKVILFLFFLSIIWSHTLGYFLTLQVGLNILNMDKDLGFDICNRSTNLLGFESTIAPSRHS